MALVSDFTREVVTATGTADYTLTGAPGSTPYIPFLTAFSSGSEVLYTVKSSSYKWEIVLGTVTSPSTLSRTTVIASWNGTTLGTSKISWGGGDGTLFAYCSPVASGFNGRFNGSKSADIASATTTDIGAATGEYVVVTGTTTITGLGTVHPGTWRMVNFSGVLTLTHNGTSLILPGGRNIVTAAGDIGTFVSLGSGNWVCTNYQRSNGGPSSQRPLLATLTASNSTALNFTATDTTQYAGYECIFENVVPATDNTSLLMQYSVNGGSSYLTTGYVWQIMYGLLSSATAGAGGSTSDSSINMGGGNSNNSAHAGISGKVIVVVGGAATNATKMFFETYYIQTGGTSIATVHGGGSNAGSSSQVDAFRFLMASGNITSGTIRVYGIPK